MISISMDDQLASYKDVKLNWLKLGHKNTSACHPLLSGFSGLERK